MKIALLTMGTRGDVQPFAVLGKALKQRGHDVTLSTAKNFEALVGSYGLNFAPVEADFQAILNSPEGKKMMRNPFSARKHLDRLIFPMIYDSLQTFYNVTKENDRVLFHVKAMADQFVEHFPDKLIMANVVPAIEPTREFVNPVFSTLPLPAFLNRFTYKLSELGLKMMSKPVNQFRQEKGMVGKYRKRKLPSIYGISPLFLPQPRDYPESSHFTGFWIEDSQQELEQDIVDFLFSGTPPLLITLGSMPFDSKMNLPNLLASMSRALNTRIIVIKGWGIDDTAAIQPGQNSNIKIIESAPYDKLLPHVKAVIHHGGIGTIAACLKSGKPFLTCPVLYPLGDQHFWGSVAYKKGVGLKPLPLKKLREDLLIDATRKLLKNEQLYRNSRKFMKEMENENGVVNAISLIEKMY
jgi:sterol 3beta-glucosyltransferase